MGYKAGYNQSVIEHLDLFPMYERFVCISMWLCLLSCIYSLCCLDFRQSWHTAEGSSGSSGAYSWSGSLIPFTAPDCLLHCLQWRLSQRLIQVFV